MTDISFGPAGTADPVMTAAGDVDRARSGDDAAFTRVIAPLRRELHAHCYRMLGSTHDADDALQEALLRAWRGMGGFQRRSSLRSWLYTVATRTCLDAAAGRKRRALPMDLGPASERAVVGDTPRNEVSWLGPYPDSGLGSVTAGPASRYEQREAVELAFVAAVAYLPGNQRAALLLFEVLAFSAAEIAIMLETTTASVNSALQRARRIVAERVPDHSQQQTLRQLPDARVREIVSGYTGALERGDAEALIALLTEDVTWSMPPLPHWYRGLAAVTDFALEVPLTSCGSWRHLPCGSNGQPAVASYRWDPSSGCHLAFAINVLTLRNDMVCEITTFIGAEQFDSFGLPGSVA